MMRFTMILSAMFFALNVSFAQSNDQLKGPAAKNYKPWKQQSKNTVVMTDLREETAKGPAYKNRKVWVETDEKVLLNTELKYRERVTGPKAKNRKPWNAN